jgi:hypothetical protein
MSKVLDYFIETPEHKIVTALRTADRDEAYDEFAAQVRTAPHRPLVMRGPDWCTYPESTVDPLITGPGACRAVLSDVEYREIVLGRVAEAVLSS